jgi:hypothetical protein
VFQHIAHADDIEQPVLPVLQEIDCLDWYMKRAGGRFGIAGPNLDACDIEAVLAGYSRRFPV